MCITFGIDVGCQTHHFAVYIPQTNKFEEFQISHNQNGFKQALNKLNEIKEKYQDELLGGLECVNGYGNPLDQYLIEHGIKLKQINSLRLNRYRELFGQKFKTDLYDAKLAASFVRNHNILQIEERKCLYDIVREDDKIEKLRILTRYQTNLIKEKNRITNRLQKHIRGYFPEYFEIIKPEQLDNYNSLSLMIECFQIDILKNRSEEDIANIKAEGSRKVGIKLAKEIKSKVMELEWQPRYTETICRVIKSEALRLLELKKEIRNLDKEIELLDIKMVNIIRSYPGAGIRSAGRLAGEIIDIKRFKTANSLALYLGVGGIEESSGKKEKVKSSRSINHYGKKAIMEIAFSSIMWNEKSRLYYLKMRGKGKNHWEAVKRVARQIVKVLYAMLINEKMYEENYVDRINCTTNQEGSREVGRLPIQEVQQAITPSASPNQT